MIGTEEYVFGFDITVDDILGMQVLQALHNLVEECSNEGSLQAMLMLFDQVQQVPLEILEDEVNLALLFEGLLDADHVVALQHLQHLDFALDGLAGKFVLVALLELLNRHSHYL